MASVPEVKPTQGISLGGLQPKVGLQGSVPLEKQKSNVIDTLYKMHDDMRACTMDMEDSLNKAYAGISGGLTKKFGFENISGVHRNEEGAEFLPAKKIEREIEKMNRHAEEFLKALPEKHLAKTQHTSYKSLTNST